VRVEEISVMGTWARRLLGSEMTRCKGRIVWIRARTRVPMVRRL